MKTEKKPSMKNRLILSPLALLALCGLVLLAFSCRKEKDDSDIDDTVSAEVGQLENISTDADNMLAQVFEGDSVQQRHSEAAAGVNFVGCAIVSHDTVNHVIIVNYGTGCTGLDGRTRAGRIMVSYSGHYFVPGYSHTMTFDSFYVDTRHIEGTRIVTNTGLNSLGNMCWSVSAINMKMTLTSGYWRTWNSSRTREMTQGLSTPLGWLDDVYRINGNGSGANSNGQNFTADMVNVVRKNTCRWITSGTISITPSGRQTRIIDFGSGNCDDQATVSIGNYSRTITLR